MYEEAEADAKTQEEILGGKRGVMRKGYLGHVVKIGQLLKKIESNKKYEGIFEGDKWKAIKALVDQETFEAEKNLAGYSTKRGEAAPNIMFSR